MSLESLSPAYISIFGSLVTIEDADDLEKLSPANQDVEYYPGGARCRGGLATAFPAIAGAPAIPSLKSYVNSAGQSRLLLFTAAGELRKDAAGILNLITANLANNARMKAVTALGREWLGFSDGTQGVDLPRQFDDVNLDRVSPEGPGAGPIAVDSGVAGNVVAGVHSVGQFFITRNGYWTRLSPVVAWAAAGGKKAQFTLNVGPAGTVGRGIAVTLAGGATYYCMTDRMLINDNVTTVVTIDFTDSALSGGQPVDYLRTLEILPDAMMPIEYASRIIWIGEQPMMQYWANIQFDGGFAGNVPLGWTPGPAGGSEDTVNSAWGSAYRITGDGATAVRATITQNALIDAFQGAPLLLPNVPYTVKARIMRSAGLVAGRLNIDIFGAAGTVIDTVGLQVTAAQATQGWVEYTAQLTPAQVALSTDLVLRVFADQTPTNGEYFVVDDIRIFPTLQQRKSIARASRASQPEAYNGLTGLILVKVNNGQDLRCHFVMRDFYYLVKERGIYVTQDDGSSEPGFWTLTPVSETIGTPSADGVGLGEGFAIIANDKGAYKFSGGTITDENKIMQEIQPTWDRVNWAGAGQTVWVKVDKKRKLVLFGVPLDGALTPNAILVLNYQEGWADPITQSGNSGEWGGRGRKWTIWNIPAASCEEVPLATGNTFYFGSAGANGKIYTQALANLSDDGVAINSFYRTWYLTRNTSGGRALHGRNMIGYLTGSVYGVGKLNVTAYRDAAPGSDPIGSWTLALLPNKELEIFCDLHAERIALQVGTNAVGSNWNCSHLAAHMKEDPWAPISGT